MNSSFSKVGLFIALLIGTLKSSGTHIAGGFIQIKEANGTTITFRVYGIRDTGSNIEIGGGSFIFGYGSEKHDGPHIVTKKLLSNGFEEVYFEVTHTFPSAGTYTVSYSEEFRNADLLNCANSVGTQFYMEMTFTMDPFIANTFPSISSDLVLLAYTGIKYENSVQVTDPDGDLIYFSIEIPKQARGKEVNHFRYPWSPEFYSDYSTGSENGEVPIADLNKVTGNFLWNSPGDAISESHDGPEYANAIRVSEKRKVNGQWITLSSSTVDFNILVDLESEEAAQLSVAFPWVLCSSEPPYELQIMTEHRTNLSVDLPFLKLENGDSADLLDGLVIESDDTTFYLFPDPNFDWDGFRLGRIILETDDFIRRRVNYNVLYATDCELLEEFQLITGVVNPVRHPILFPNPNQGTFYLRGEGLATMRVMDLSGKLVYQQKISGMFQPDQHLSEGVYLVQLFDSEQRLVHTERMVVSR